MTKTGRTDQVRHPRAPLQIVPLGGVGEFGSNCTVLRHGTDLVVIDAGLLFPEEQSLGVNFVIPDLSYIEERAAEVRGILLTHAHEDHVGALPWLFDKVRVPVYGSDFTVGLTFTVIVSSAGVPVMVSVPMPRPVAVVWRFRPMTTTLPVPLTSRWFAPLLPSVT